MALTLIRLGALGGLSAALYGYYTELELARAAATGSTYVAACDMGAFASCSKVLSSSYAHVLSHWGLVPRHHPLDISNALMGAAFYLFALVHDRIGIPRSLFLFASVGTLAFTGYLAYVLKFVLKDFCLVCGAMYIANALIFIGAARRALASPSGKARVKGKDE